MNAGISGCSQKRIRPGQDRLSTVEYVIANDWKSSMSVYHFGAVGDGKADDTQALQHALDAGDGILELEKGTYRITQPLIINTVENGYG